MPVREKEDEAGNPVRGVPGTEETKTCSGCKTERPYPDGYHRDRTRRDGRAAHCKDCVSRRTARWAAANRERKNETDRAYKLRRADRQKAHAAIKLALKRGWVVRPEACEYCGAGGEIEGHHTDYGHPLQVVWLCKACHGKEHSHDADTSSARFAMALHAAPALRAAVFA